MTRDEHLKRRAAPDIAGMAVVEIDGAPMKDHETLRTWHHEGRQGVEIGWRGHNTALDAIGENVYINPRDVDLTLAPAMGGAVRTLRGRLSFWNRTGGGVDRVMFFEQTT